MSSDDGKSGTLFEGLLNDSPESKDLAKLFADKNLQIVSPTVAGFLSGLRNSTDAGLDGCDSSFDSDVEFEQAIVLQDPKNTGNSEIIKEFTSSITSFIDRVSDTRASYIPAEEKEAAISFGVGGSSASKKESYENAFMRMLGMPSDADLKLNKNQKSVDGSIKLFYFSPDSTTAGKVTRRYATLSQMLGIDTSGLIFSNILAERKKIIDSKTNGEKRTFDFKNVIDIDEEYNKKYKEFVELLKKAEGTSSETPGDSSKLNEAERILGYHIPQQLFRFYYLKSVPVQDSNVYGCIIDSSKIVAKPFDSISYQKINGIRPKTSLLESIIRLRLDRITGNPVIYGYSESDPGEQIITNPKNVNQDSLTEVECFLIKKLKEALNIVADNYISDIYEKETVYIMQSLEKATETQGPDDKANTPNQGGAGEPGSKPPAPPDQSAYPSELQDLEILKAKEDAILFLLKDTSSSYSSGGSSSQFSSLDIQEGIIRSSSGFSDVLSGPLYSILSFRSEFFGKMIKEKIQKMDAEKAKISTGGASGNSDKLDKKGFSPNPNSTTSTYLGITPEDFIIYILAMLIINQDYLIGLLPYENRKNLANTISSSIINTAGRNKDPYGILERLEKSPEEGGFPSVVDSVNAMGILATSLYEEHISYILKWKERSKKDVGNSIGATRGTSS